MRLLLLLIICFNVSCNSKITGFSEKACKEFNEKYVEYALINKIDSALFYVDKSIKCDLESDFYKVAKINLLISDEQYENAINYLSNFKLDKEPVYKMLKGVLLLKLQNKQEALGLLEEAYNHFKDEETSGEMDYNLIFYMLGLENYFNGSDSTINSIKDYKIALKDNAYAIETLEYAKILIETSSKEDSLYKMFNIN